jgi:hypothetical protein
MRPGFDLHVSVVTRQHPDRNLQTASARLYDGHCTITGFGSADDPESPAVQWVEGIENMNVSRSRTQGIVRAGFTIRISTASSRPVV